MIRAVTAWGLIALTVAGPAAAGPDEGGTPDVVVNGPQAGLIDGLTQSDGMGGWYGEYTFSSTLGLTGTWAGEPAAGSYACAGDASLDFAFPGGGPATGSVSCALTEGAGLPVELIGEFDAWVGPPIMNVLGTFEGLAGLGFSCMGTTFTIQYDIESGWGQDVFALACSIHDRAAPADG